MNTITFCDKGSRAQVEKHLDDLKKQILEAWDKSSSSLSIHTHKELEEIDGGLLGYPAYFMRGWTYGVSIGDYLKEDKCPDQNK